MDHDREIVNSKLKILLKIKDLDETVKYTFTVHYNTYKIVKYEFPVEKDKIFKIIEKLEMDDVIDGNSIDWKIDEVFFTKNDQL